MRLRGRLELLLELHVVCLELLHARVQSNFQRCIFRGERVACVGC